ncbi:hypothetical protein FRB96_002367 [Tulasnella sp. 330]|nr:hypothetical protein FRB96_002367 [Tulasnella sp. 330]KAG8883117.1 hypothetical protein FRB97_007254 [Tulasnella sp. 331]KAG8886029.1 hypothetical protein FRB98_001505 [Tulasnella sp. 332]
MSSLDSLVDTALELVIDGMSGHGLLATPESVELGIGLDKNISDVKQAVQWLSRRAWERIARLSQYRNSLASIIHRLPTELLVNILTRVVQFYDWPDYYYFVRLQRLAQVCRAWNVIIKGSAELWNVINLSHDDSTIRIALDRSKACPLKLMVRQDGPHTNAMPTWPEVSAQMRRWGEMDVALRNIQDAEELAVPLEKSGPMALNRLKLYVNQGGELAELFGGQTPKLVHVDLQGVIVRQWNPAVLQQLRWLALSNIEMDNDQHIWTTEKVLDVLQECPRLSYLAIRKVKFEEGNATERKLIRLQVLEHLILEGISSNAIQRIACALHTPRCTFYRLVSLQKRRANATNLKALGERVVLAANTAMTDGWGDTSNLAIRVRDQRACSVPRGDQITLQLTSGIGKVTVEVNGFMLREVVEWWEGIVPHDKLRGIRVHLDFAGKSLNCSEYDIVDAISHLPSVVKLALSSIHFSADVVLDRLSKPRSVGDGWKWLAPKLEYLDLSNTNCSGRSLLVFAQSRPRCRVLVHKKLMTGLASPRRCTSIITNTDECYELSGAEGCDMIRRWVDGRIDEVYGPAPNCAAFFAGSAEHGDMVKLSRGEPLRPKLEG